MQRQKKQFVVPVRYLPKRIFTLWRQGVLDRKLVYAAAMFCYFHEHEWMLHTGVGTNFPQGYKVQTSVKKSDAGRSISQTRPPEITMNVLLWCLIEGAKFREIAIRGGIDGSKRTLHRAGRDLVRKHLGIFWGVLDG